MGQTKRKRGEQKLGPGIRFYRGYMILPNPPGPDQDALTWSVVDSIGNVHHGQTPDELRDAIDNLAGPAAAWRRPTRSVKRTGARPGPGKGRGSK